MAIVAKILTPEAIADGKTLDSTDPTDYSIHSDYQNVKFLDPDNFPAWPTVVAMPNYSSFAGVVSLYSVQHNLGYIPIKKMFYRALDGRIYPIPSNSKDLGTEPDSTKATFEMRRSYDPDTDTWSITYPSGVPDLSEQINIIMTNPTIIAGGIPTDFDVFHMLFVNESE